MTYIVLATTASLALHAPLGMAIGFVAALITALAQSHGTMPERARQILRVDYLRAMTTFAVVALVTDALDDWKIAAIAWLVAAFATGAWRTHGPLAAKSRWALLSRFGGAAAGLAMAWLNMNWVTTPLAVWFLLVALVSAGALKAALRWPDLPWIEHALPASARPTGALASLLMSALIVGASIV
ncbi:hypothetical protein V6K52_03805 [Knoellia sp. S7-12]|uniref:hypothetical protein n=1 Tax=Knoellia sp. S7-12 TaxID=3126698 RepID=UPI003367790B